MSHNWSRYVLNIVWLVGLFVLVLIGYHYEQVVKKIDSITYIMMPEFWFSACVPFMLGIYFALLFIKEWTFRANAALFLCVCLPCVMLSFYSPVVYTFVAMTSSSSSFTVPIPFWLMKLNYLGIVPLVAGFTLMFGLFGTSKNSSMSE